MSVMTATESAPAASASGARPSVMFDPFFLEGVAGDPALNQPDRIHPNAKGAAMVAERMVPLVAALLAKVGRN